MLTMVKYLGRANGLHVRNWKESFSCGCLASKKNKTEEEESRREEEGRESWTIRQEVKASVVLMANPFGSAICFLQNLHFFQFTYLVISACTSANYFSSYFIEEIEDTMWEQPHITIHLTSKRYLGARLYFTLDGNKCFLYFKDNFSFCFHLNPSTAFPIGPLSFYSFLLLPYNHVLEQHKNILNFKSCFLRNNWFRRNSPHLWPVLNLQFILPPFHLGFIHYNCVKIALFNSTMTYLLHPMNVFLSFGT